MPAGPGGVSVHTDGGNTVHIPDGIRERVNQFVGLLNEVFDMLRGRRDGIRGDIQRGGFLQMLFPVSPGGFHQQRGGDPLPVNQLFNLDMLTPEAYFHRLGSTALADRIFVIDGGRIAEEGSQAELLAKKGPYAEMFEAQRSWYQ